MLSILSAQPMLPKIKILSCTLAVGKSMLRHSGQRLSFSVEKQIGQASSTNSSQETSVTMQKVNHRARKLTKRPLLRSFIDNDMNLSTAYRDSYYQFVRHTATSERNTLWWAKLHLNQTTNNLKAWPWHYQTWSSSIKRTYFLSKDQKRRNHRDGSKWRNA